MKIDFISATIEDVNDLINIYNSSFYSDYVRYGYCPAYNKSYAEMTSSIINYPKYIIRSDGKKVGVISFGEEKKSEFYLRSLCVIPEYQNLGIGYKAIQFMQENCKNYSKIYLETPADKVENIYFYVNKCGFSLGNYFMDGPVKLVVLYKTKG